MAVSPDEARADALSLPEAVELDHHGRPSFRVNGKIFVTVPPGEAYLHVFVGEAETEASVAEDPAAFAPLLWGTKQRGLRVTLAVPRWRPSDDLARSHSAAGAGQLDEAGVTAPA